MYDCPHCGNELPDSATFCNQCWQTVSADASATSPGVGAPTVAADPGDDKTTVIGASSTLASGDGPPRPPDAPRFEPPGPGTTQGWPGAGATYAGGPPPPSSPPPLPVSPWSAQGGADVSGGWDGSSPVWDQPPPPPPPPGAYGAYGAPAGYGPYGAPAYAPGPSTNGMAIASLVCSLLSFVTCFSWVLGVIFGHIALSQIKRSEGRQGGRGLAVAGLVIGYTFLVLVVGFILLAIAGSASSSG